MTFQRRSCYTRSESHVPYIRVPQKAQYPRVTTQDGSQGQERLPRHKAAHLTAYGPRNLCTGGENDGTPANATPPAGLATSVVKGFFLGPSLCSSPAHGPSGGTGWTQSGQDPGAPTPQGLEGAVGIIARGARVFWRKPDVHVASTCAVKKALRTSRSRNNLFFFGLCMLSCAQA